MPTDYIKAADLHTALARVRDETKAKVWAEAYAAGQKAEQEQYAKAIQLVTLGRALGGFGQMPAVVTQQLPFGDTELKARPEGADYSWHNDTTAAHDATLHAVALANVTDNPNTGMLYSITHRSEKNNSGKEQLLPNADNHLSVARSLITTAEHHEQEVEFLADEGAGSEPDRLRHERAAAALRNAAKLHTRAARRYMTEDDEALRAPPEIKAFVENPALPRRENPDGPAYGKLLQLPEGWVHPDGAVTPLTHAGEAHVAALAEADPGVSQAFHASLARHAHRKHPGEFVDDDVKDYAFDKGFIHLTGRGRTIEATGKHEMLLKHRKFLKDLAMRSTTLVFRPVDGDDYEVKAKADRINKAIPANPAHRTEAVVGTHHVVQDALSRGDTQYANRQREIHADALVDAGADREAAVERVIAGQQPPSHLAATFRNAANLKRAARSRTEAAHEATATAYEASLNSRTEWDAEPEAAGEAFNHSYYAQHAGTADTSQPMNRHQRGAAAYHHLDAVKHHETAVEEHAARADDNLMADNPDGLIDHAATAAHEAAITAHRHAAEQHRIAAAYNAAAHHADSQRTVKAQEDYHPRFRDDLHDAGRQHEMEGPPTPGLRSQEAYVVSDRLMDEALHTHGLHVPYSSLENAHEKAFDAADIGDDAGRRYWHRRARDLHILMRGQLGATPGDPVRQAHEKAMSLHGKASADGSADRGVLRAHASLTGDEQAQVAHAIGSHGGDVSAAAKTATAAANKLTDPEKDFGTVARVWGVPVVVKNHADAASTHVKIAEGIPRGTAYRPATVADVPDDVVNQNSYFYKPREDGVGRPTEWFPTNHPTRDTTGGFSVPMKSSNGLTADMTHHNVGEWSVYDADTEHRRSEAFAAHRVASYLHQEAATGDHLNREVKAVRTNYDKMEQHEGSHEPQVGDYAEDDADTSNPVHSQFYRSEKLFHESERAGHLHTLQRQYPDLDPYAINEKMLDAADLGDEAGHRYWKRRLGDVHLMLAEEDGPGDLHTHHAEQGRVLHNRPLFDPAAPTVVTAAHLIAHHKGDVAAAARHASEAAIKATDPGLLGHARKVMGGDPFTTRPEKYHGDMGVNHETAAHSIKLAPDTYRPLTLHDIDRHEAGEFVQFFRKPRTPGESPHMRTFSVGKVQRGSSPNEFHLPAYSGQAITHENMHDVETIDTDAHQHRLDLQQMHQVAALLHREAATGDHEKREVKAERKAFAPGIEAEPGAAGRTLHPTAGHPAADNNEAALHAAMLVQPHDTTPRMVLADYYDDHDQPHTAALHRFVAEPTRANFDTLAKFHEHPSEVAHTVEHAAAMHADATIPRWVAVDRGVDYEDERRHPATGAILPTGLRNELNNVIHRNAYHPSVQRFPADSPNRTERRLTRDSLMWHHQRYGEEQTNFAAAHADPSTVADWGPDPISETGHAFARTLHHAAAEAHRHARDYLTEQDALDKPTTNDGPIPEDVWRHPRLNREGTV